MDDQKFINLINDNVFKSDIVHYTIKDLILYDQDEDLKNDKMNHILNILNHLLALNVSYESTFEDIKKLNIKFEYLGFKLNIYNEDTIKDLKHYGNIIFKEDKSWELYFDIMKISNKSLFLVYQDSNNKIDDYNNVYTIIKAKEYIYVKFDKIY